MQRLTFALWLSLFVFLISSCKRTEVDGVKPGIPTGVATPVGTPDNTPASQMTIGPAGGSLTSTDGRLKVTIPADALSSAQTVSIQSISNKNPMAIQQAYRITPHNVTFSKPVTLEFSYSDDDVKNTIPEALGIAYQDANNIWKAKGGVTVDKNAKTVTVTTTHFSDWTLFESFYLIASGTQVSVNGTINLEVFTTDDILVPLVAGEEVAMGNKVSMATSAIKEWRLAGAGNLQPAGAKAVYRAPGTVPSAPNPVAVSVSLDLKQRGTFLLLRHIKIVNDDGEIEVRVAGNGWVTKTASRAIRKPDGSYSIADSDGDTQGSYVLITWTGGVGTHPYRQPTSLTGTYVHYLITGNNNYICQYINSSHQLVASGGGVTITSMGDDDGYIKGTFAITPAGFGPMLNQTTNVEGRFRVRKGWQ